MDEGAALEMLCRGNSTVGSNPTLSAIFFLVANHCRLSICKSKFIQLHVCQQVTLTGSVCFIGVSESILSVTRAVERPVSV